MCFGDSNWNDDEVVVPEVVEDTTEFNKYAIMDAEGVVSADELGEFISNTEPNQENTLILLAAVASRGVDDKGRDAIVGGVQSTLVEAMLVQALGGIFAGSEV